MKSLSLLLLFIGSLMFVTGLTEQRVRKGKDRIIYKYLPKSLYDTQFETYDFNKSMPAIFDEDYTSFYR